MPRRCILAAIAGTQLATAAVIEEHRNMNDDRKQVLHHIDTIFQAFLRQDREAIRRNHTEDWVGFQGPSTKIERGLDDYMVNAERSLQLLKGTGYELLDTEVQLYGDLALVYYVARYDFVDREKHEGSLMLRSIDVYRKENGKWNQCGSHITPMPSGGNWGEGGNAPNPRLRDWLGGRVRKLSDDERIELLKAREAVWRAWFSGDLDTLRQVVPEEAIALDPGVAEWADQPEILRRSKDFAAGRKLTRLEFPKTRILAYGPVAILYTQFVIETDGAEGPKFMTGRGTELFVRRDGRWVNSGWQLEQDGN